MDEVTYGDIDEDGVPIEATKRSFRPSELSLKYPGLLKQAMELTNRSYLLAAEKSKWERIDRMLDKDELDAEWIQGRLDWAEQNKWVDFPKLMVGILNLAKYEDWKRRQNEKRDQGRSR